MKHNLTLPVAERVPQQSDESLLKFIKMMEDAINNDGSYEAEIKAALDHVRSERERMLGFEFWHAFEEMRFRKGLSE